MFSIITPTYNRAHTLSRVYESLLNQTDKRFVWLIADDCSKDDTSQLVKKWIDEGKINIKYHQLPVNQGKNPAVNEVLDFCEMPYTIVADSDDSFDANTLSDLLRLWEEIDAMEKSREIASIWTLTKDEKGNIVGDKFPKDRWIVAFEERVLNHDIQGEKWACWRTDILKNHKMFAIPKYYIGESHTWNSINRNYDFLCVNMAHRNYHDSPDGIMATNYSAKKTAIMKYYSAYFGLKDIKTSDIMAHSYFRFLAFDYIASSFRFRDKKYRLSLKKHAVCSLIFMMKLPKKAFKKLT